MDSRCRLGSHLHRGDNRCCKMGKYKEIQNRSALAKVQRQQPARTERMNPEERMGAWLAQW